MKLNLAIAVIFVIAIQLQQVEAGKKDKGEDKGKSNCNKWKKNLKNCLKKGKQEY